LPTHDLRNDHLNQAAYALYLFIRDIAEGDLIGWIDQQLQAANSPDVARHRPRHQPACRTRRQGLRFQIKPRSRTSPRDMSGNPVRSSTEDMPAFFPKILYKGRGRIEQAVGFKRVKRIALRCVKTARNYGSFVALALGFLLIKSVHTA
jgi:hypothetical protein